jgi:hypothetical protein
MTIRIPNIDLFVINLIKMSNVVEFPEELECSRLFVDNINICIDTFARTFTLQHMHRAFYSWLCALVAFPVGTVLCSDETTLNTVLTSAYFGCVFNTDLFSTTFHVAVHEIYLLLPRVNRLLLAKTSPNIAHSISAYLMTAKFHALSPMGIPRAFPHPYFTVSSHI